MLKWYKNYMGYVREGFTYTTYPFRPKSNPNNRFVIFTVGRSGSGVLVNLLQSHTSIHCDDELFQRKLFSPLLYLRAKEQLSKQDVYGFKLNTYHFRIQKTEDPVQLVAEINNNGYKIINLRRRNLLRQAISHMYALHRDLFHDRASQKKQKQEYKKFIVGLDKLQEELYLFETYRALQTRILTHFPYLQLYYEDDLLNSARHQATIDKISSFLGVPSSPVHTNMRKTTPKKLSTFVENYDEVKGFLIGTKYAEFLEMGQI